MAIIQTAGHGIIGATSGWSIFGSKMLDSPNTQIVAYDSGGFFPNPKWLLDQPTVQVMVRGNIMDYLGAYSKAIDIKNTLLGSDSQTVSGTQYTGILMEGDIILVEYDNLDRPLLSLNFIMWREPSSTVSSNRTAIS
jgi:hypothetical protein